MCQWLTNSILFTRMDVVVEPSTIKRKLKCIFLQICSWWKSKQGLDICSKTRSFGKTPHSNLLYSVSRSWAWFCVIMESYFVTWEISWRHKIALFLPGLRQGKYALKSPFTTFPYLVLRLPLIKCHFPYCVMQRTYVVYLIRNVPMRRVSKRQYSYFYASHFEYL